MDDTLGRLRAGELAGTHRLRLACGLTAFPPEIFDLADSLEILDLSGNALRSLPDDLHRLHRLRVLFCSDNRFTELPRSLGRCANLDMVGFKANRIGDVPAEALPPRLRWLILTDNDIAELPDALGHRPRLQKLMLAGNRLRSLPDTMANCTRLELLRIAANRFERLPAWLWRLPRLAWLAFGGNPLSAAREDAVLSAHALPEIDAADLEVRERLGEGASGVIHRALWRRGDGGLQPVAVKHFKGAITSDGTPRSEMAACIAAGDHAGLIGVQARVPVPAPTPAAEGTAADVAASDGLALRLVDPAFAVLAGPPSLASCTRDVYADATRFTPAQARRLAAGIASAAAHLHARGILHGDLYAHNILWNREAPPDGEALLGDFGAASFFEAAGDAASALERIEVRAFGCLLEELTARCDRGRPSAGTDDADAAGDEAARTLAGLEALQALCLQDEPASRPGFAHIEAVLAR
jgi:hypothetical protein